eukprot:UN19988
MFEPLKLTYLFDDNEYGIYVPNSAQDCHANIALNVVIVHFLRCYQSEIAEVFNNENA